MVRSFVARTAATAVVGCTRRISTTLGGRSHCTPDSAVVVLTSRMRRAQDRATDIPGSAARARTRLAVSGPALPASEEGAG